MQDSDQLREIVMRDLSAVGLRTEGLTVRSIAGGITGSSYRVDLSDRTVFVKRYDSGPHAASDEFEALNRARKMSLSERVASPLTFNEDERLLYLDWIDGKDLRVLMRAPWSSPARFRACLRDAGRWLAALHAASGPLMKPMDTLRRLEIIERQDTDGLLNRIEPYRSAWLALGDSAAELKDHEVPWALAHGDFKIDNLMAARDGHLVGVDLALRYRIPVYYDLTNFNSNLKTNLAKSPSVPLRLQRRRLESGFLDSYREASGRPLSWSILAWCSLGAALTHAATAGDAGAASLRGRLRSRVVRRRLARLIERMKS